MLRENHGGRKMKKLLSPVLCIIIAFSAVMPSFAAGEDALAVDSGRTVIALSEELIPAAEKLAEYIGKVCGKAPEVSGNSGVSPALKLEIDPSKKENGYIIEASGQDIVITGSSLAQTVRGIYAFLEKYAGINCYTSALTVFEKESIAVPADEKYEYTPYFEFTDTDWLSPKDAGYSLFNGINSAEYRAIPAELGGAVDYISSMGHTLSNQFCKSDKYFEQYPECFALYHGIRVKNQLCLTNPKTVEIVKSEVFELLKEKHDPDAELQIVSLTQPDNILFCTCVKCRMFDRDCGSHAGTMIRFVNEIARAVKEAGYENVAIDTFAYRYTRTPPKGIVPDDNVIVRLCSIECCFSRAFDDSSCETNAAFMKDLKGWSEICSRLYIWDYCTNYSNFVGIFPDFGTLQRNMQIFYEHNVKGIYEEGNYAMTADTEFGELRSYLIGRLFLNPYTDLKAARDKFLGAYYGAGGPYIGEFLDIITENAGKKHLGIYELMSNTLSLSESEISECDALWQKAKDAAEGDAKTAVLKSELSWRYWKMKNNAGEFASFSARTAEKEKLTEEINAQGVRWSEVDEPRNTFVAVFQYLYFKAYPLVLAVLNLLYAV